MKIEKIEKYLEEVSEGTDFSFTVEEEENKELTLYMQGDNPEGEDWCETLTIQNPKTKRELIDSLYEEVWNCYIRTRLYISNRQGISERKSLVPFLFGE